MLGTHAHPQPRMQTSQLGNDQSATARNQALQHPLAPTRGISSRPLVVRELELTRRPRYQRHPLDSTEHRKVWIRLERRDTDRLTMAVLVVPHTTACKVALVAMLGVFVVALPEGWRLRLVMGSLLRMVLAHLHLAPPLQ